MKVFFIILFFITIHTSDPYSVLGISRRASDHDIKKAFNELSKKWHPDRNKDPSAASKYQQIINAYELLKEPERRRVYDMTGETNTNNIDNNQYQRFQHNNFHNPFGDIDQIFKQFQQQIHRQRQQQQSYQRFQQQQNYRQQQDDQEYVTQHFIDDFGNIRTVTMRRPRNQGSGFLHDLLMIVLNNPLLLFTTFLIALLGLSNLCTPPQENNKD